MFSKTIDVKDLDPQTPAGRQNLKALAVLGPDVKQLTIKGEDPKLKAREAEYEELDYGRYDNQRVSALSDLLATSQSLQSLSLEDVQLGTATGAFALSLKKFNRSLRFLEITGLEYSNTTTYTMDLDAHGSTAMLLAEVLSENNSLVHLKLHSPSLNKKIIHDAHILIHAGGILYHACRQNAVQSLDLSGIHIGKSPLEKSFDEKEIQESVAQNTVLKVLALRNCAFPLPHRQWYFDKPAPFWPIFTPFLRGLRDNKHLEILDLSRYAITDDSTQRARYTGAPEEAISDVVGLVLHNTALRALSLQGWCFRDEIAINLADALEKNTSLLHFNAINNQLTHKGIAAFAKAIRGNRRLRRLELYSTQKAGFGSDPRNNTADNILTAESLAALSQSLKENKILSPVGLTEPLQEAEPKAMDFISRVAALNAEWAKEQENFDRASGLNDHLPKDPKQEVMFNYPGNKLSRETEQCLAERAAKGVKP